MQLSAFGGDIRLNLIPWQPELDMHIPKHSSLDLEMKRNKEEIYHYRIYSCGVNTMVAMLCENNSM